MEGLPEPEPEPLLFELICQSAPAVEHPEIKRLLGPKLVDENADLANEVATLGEILADYQAETSQIKEHKAKSQALLQPDRQRLLANIQFFVPNWRPGAQPAAGREHPAATQPPRPAQEHSRGAAPVRHPARAAGAAQATTAVGPEAEQHFA